MVVKYLKKICSRESVAKRMFLALPMVASLTFSAKAFAGMSYLETDGDGRIRIEGRNAYTHEVDTSWTVIRDLNHQDLMYYLDEEQGKGVKVIYMCALLSACDENYYHDKALRQCNIVRPYTTNGSKFEDVTQYDYWDNMCYVIKECEKRGIYVVLLPLGKDVMEKTKPSRPMVRVYMNLLCKMVEKYRNVAWTLDGGVMELEEMVQREMVGAIEVHNKRQVVVK